MNNKIILYIVILLNIINNIKKQNKNKNENENENNIK